MKKLFIFSLLTTLLFLSCSKDDSSDNSDDEQINIDSEIVGRWKLNYYTPYEEGGIMYSIEECEKESIYVYNADGTGEYEYVLTIDDAGTCAVDGEGTFEYSIDGDQITAFGNNQSSTFSIENDILTVIYPDDTMDTFIKTTDPFFSEQ